MRRQVDLQRRRVRVGTVAVGTLVGFVFVVLPLVRLRGETQRRVAEPFRPSSLPPSPLRRVTYLEVGQLGESLFTAGVGAFIRPVARVDSVRERLKHLK